MATKRTKTPPSAPLGRPGGPGTDEDPFGVSLIKSASGQAYVLPRSVARLDPETAELVTLLQDHAVYRAELEEHIDGLVDGLRERNVSWAVIGWSLGTTGEAARQRWGVD